ncbi:hypothetical protein CYMTET_46282 [Cymbomonas tetramitiformis]|uniref:BZIP domain-containing protein n=1 Tax=Cymbomonas tetramitiformis TaxID=36881 RepID=A0AAE0BYI7_9CHLO|nr:hypothetical protein CYMTET_46282 [Cymbomonas tetramitiformis]
MPRAKSKKKVVSDIPEFNSAGEVINKGKDKFISRCYLAAIIEGDKVEPLHPRLIKGQAIYLDKARARRMLSCRMHAEKSKGRRETRVAFLEQQEISLGEELRRIESELQIIYRQSELLDIGNKAMEKELMDVNDILETGISLGDGLCNQSHHVFQS